MGIVSSFVNNLTTNGVLTADAINNASLNSITSIPGGGDLKLISEATASSSASIEFSLGSYKEYQFYFVNMHPQNNGIDFTFQTSIDNGSNYNVIITSTNFYAYHSEGDYTTLTYNTADDQAQGTSFQPLITDMGNANDESLTGSLQLFSPSSTTYVKHFISRMQGYNGVNPGSADMYTAGYFNNGANNLTNIKFQMSSGNIDAGTIKMFAVV